ncbi:2-nitropropane dioxygenase [Alkalihalophilus pseudofirmus]|nr:2-nitropropane dioxygenase [Alkalihalophilus pseudofirmus]
MNLSSILVNNRICEILGIEHPIIQGGLAYVGNGRLAAAVSEGGGFGQIGSAGRTPEGFEEEILIARQLTKKPLGVNIPIRGYEDTDKYLEIVNKHKRLIQGVSLGGGNPQPLIPQLKAMGLKSLVMTSTVKQAQKVEQIGADIVICEGYEAGGNNGAAELTTLVLVQQVAASVSIPVVAAGGISNGKAMVAVMILGAEGVQMGTRFVATTECEAHENYKNLIVQAKDDDTIIMSRYIGGPRRVLKNDFALRTQAIERETPSVEEILPLLKGGHNKRAAIDGDIENGFMGGGQISGLIEDVISAEQVVKQVMDEAGNIFHHSSYN